MSAYSRWFYSVHLRQYYQELRGLLISQVSHSFSAPSLDLLQLNNFPHLFKGYLINHNQILGLFSLSLPLTPFPPTFLFSVFTALNPGLLYHLVSFTKSGSFIMLPAEVKHLLDSYSIVHVI